MRLFCAPVLICAALLTACAGGGSSASTAPGGLLPAKGAPAAPMSGVRRVQSAPSCSGTGTDAFVGGGTGNIAGGAYSGVLEGYSNEVCDELSSIGGGYGNDISSGGNTAYYSWIGSGFVNSISGNGYQSVIGGGIQNALTAPNSVIGGGYGNAVSVAASVIGGGYTNSISGGNTTYGTIGGGLNNSVTAEWGTVAGGNTNRASGNASNVSGGANNTASGEHATVLGGSKNTASGNQSLAAGVNSNAATPGSFVWSDDSSGATQLTSTVDNQFLARSSGGFTFWTNASNTVGATLASGSGTWASASDRAMKTNVARIDDAEVLDKVASLPISTWSYVSERGVRHVGPMAQDFYAAFGVGEDDRHITSIDEDGIALAAIKALRAQNATLQARTATLRAQNATLTAQQRELRSKDLQLHTTQVVMQHEIDQLRTFVQTIARREPGPAHGDSTRQ